MSDFLEARARQWRNHDLTRGMGAPYVPFTFPTVNAFNRMKGYGTDMGTYKAVDAMYSYYLDGLNSGANPIDFKAKNNDAHNKAIWQWMSKKYPATPVQNFFRMLHDLPEQWWRLGKGRNPVTAAVAATTSVAKKGVTTTTVATKEVAKAAGDVTAATGGAFLSAFPTKGLIFAGVAGVAILGGVVYIVAKAR